MADQTGTDLDAGTIEEHAGQEQPAKPKTPEEKSDQALIDELVENFAFAHSYESEQRAQEDEDIYFEAVDQWDPDHRRTRGEHVDEISMRKVAARPTLSINLVDQPVQRVVNEARQARLAITVTPKAGLANTKYSGYYKGLIRSIQVESGATEARIWALERTAKCGRGAYEIDTEFANDGDFDLDIVYRRILDQGTIYWDPYSVMADRRDADWCFKSAEWMSEKERMRRWPDKPLMPSEGAFTRSDDLWFAVHGDEKKRAVRVVVYYKVVYQEHVLGFHPSIGPMKLEEMPPELADQVQANSPGTRQRKVPSRSVMKVFADGTQILEKHKWEGRYIPIIPTTGKEYVVRGKRMWKGLVTNCKDVNRGYVVTMSSAVELAGTMPRSPYIMYAGQDEGFEEMWDDSPIKAYTRLYVRAMDVDGKPAPFPQRQNLEPPLQGVLFLARVLKDDIGSLTGSVDPALRAVNPYDRSGKAIDALNRQGAAGTSNYVDNLATISMPQEGRVMVDLIPKIYDKPGRVIRVMGEEDDDETAIMIKVPFVTDAEGNPVPVPCPMCKGTGEARASMWSFRKDVCPACQGMKVATRETMPAEFNGKKVNYVDLSEGEYKVTVQVGRNFQSKQEEAMAAMSDLAKAAPELVPIYADLWVRAMGFSGSTAIADRIKRTNPNAKDENDETKDIPPEMAAQMEQLKLEHAAAMQELQMAKQAIETDAVKAAGVKELTQMKIEAAAALENLKAQHKLMQDTAKGDTSKEIEMLKGELEQMRQESEQRHEVLLELLQQKAAMKIEETRQQRQRESEANSSMDAREARHHMTGDAREARADDARKESNAPGHE